MKYRFWETKVFFGACLIVGVPLCICIATFLFYLLRAKPMPDTDLPVSVTPPAIESALPGVSGEPESTAPVADDAPEHVYGNTSGNALNWSLIIQDGDWLYYSNPYDGERLYKMKTDFSENQKLCDEIYVKSINIYDRWVYFNGETGRIYRVRTNGTDFEQITNCTVLDYGLSDGWLYYINAAFIEQDLNGSKRNSIWKMSLDGSNNVLLRNEKALSLQVHDDWLYFNAPLEDEDEYGVYRMTVDGTSVERLLDVRAYLFVDGEWLYYTDYQLSNTLSRIKVDGTEQQLICDDKVSLYINKLGDYIYYTNADDNNHIYRIDVNGNNHEQLNSVHSYFINIIGDRIFYKTNDYDDYMQFYRGDYLNYMNLDGSNKGQITK